MKNNHEFVERLLKEVANELEQAQVNGEGRFEWAQQLHGGSTEHTIRFTPNEKQAVDFNLNVFDSGGLVTIVLGRGGRFELLQRNESAVDEVDRVMQFLRAARNGDVSQSVTSVGGANLKTVTIVTVGGRQIDSTVRKVSWRWVLRKKVEKIDFLPWASPMWN